MFAIVGNAVPKGGIIFYKCALAAIPAGWHLCDGTNGTDDLRDKMIICAGNSYNVDDTGGVVSHNHIFSGISHSHILQGADEIQSGGDFPSEIKDATASGTIDTVGNLPPYVAKGFIQKL